MSPARLHKKPTREDYMKEINYFITRYWGIIAVLAVIFLLFVFVAACFAIVGVSATESGVYYNGGLI